MRSSFPVSCRCRIAGARLTLRMLRGEPTRRKRQSGGTTDIMWRRWGVRCGRGRGSTIRASLRGS